MKCSSLSIILVMVLTAAESRAGDPLEDFADVPDATAAMRLAEDARALMQRNRYDEACPKLEESLRLQPRPGAHYNLADCNEHLGKLATAWTGFLEVAAQWKTANEFEREKIARKRAQALEPRLSKIVIDVPNAPDGLEVKRDGVAIQAASWATALPVDPGAHRVTATVPGKRRWVTTVTTVEGQTLHVEVPQVASSTARDPATALDDGAQDPTARERDPATSLDDGAAGESAGVTVLLGGLAALESSGALLLLGGIK
jgi:hypothetical protein